MELTFEEWRHTYADVFETDDAARAAWTAACNRGYRTGMQDTRALLAAHSAGAQNSSGSLAFDYGNALVDKRLDPSYNSGTQEPNVHQCALCGSTGDCKAKDPQLLNDCQGAWYRPATHPQPMPQTDASRHLSDLLARIHRDGGQYEAEHGIDKAVADANDKVARLNAMTDAARDEEAEFKKWFDEETKSAHYNGQSIREWPAKEAWLRRAEIAGAHPQPMTQTEAARDAEDAKRYRFIKSQMKVGAVQTQLPLYRTLHWIGYEDCSDVHNADAAIDAEIERIDRAKGE